MSQIAKPLPDGRGPISVRPSRTEEREALLRIWLRSVRATHAFVSETDIESMTPTVRDVALAKLRLWTLADESDHAIGVMGMDGNSVEMLFIDPHHFRRGGGKLLLDHAQTMHESLRLDVNEQNVGAHRFYETQGFRVVGRSEVDGQGRPYPLLHMERRRGERRCDEAQKQKQGDG